MGGNDAGRIACRDYPSTKFSSNGKELSIFRYFNVQLRRGKAPTNYLCRPPGQPGTPSQLNRRAQAMRTSTIRRQQSPMIQALHCLGAYGQSNGTEAAVLSNRSLSGIALTEWVGIKCTHPAVMAALHESWKVSPFLCAPISQ